jgi:hypothetical protein
LEFPIRPHLAAIEFAVQVRWRLIVDTSIIYSHEKGSPYPSVGEREGRGGGTQLLDPTFGPDMDVYDKYREDKIMDSGTS